MDRSERIRANLTELIRRSGMNNRSVALLAGLSPTAARDIITGKSANPQLSTLESLAGALGVGVESIVGGDAERRPAGPIAGEPGLGTGGPPGEDGDFVAIPRRDVRLSGGHGFENLDDAPVLDRIPFTREFLRDRLNRTNINGLVMVKATGDSMEPTIGHDDLVMVDAQDWDVRPGIFAVVLQGEAMVKRLEQVGDRVAVISDNKHYPPLYVGADQRHAFHVIGRVRWIGRVLT